MTLQEYEKEYFFRMDHGSARRDGIRRAIDAALETQDADGALQLYYEFMEEDVFYCDCFQATIVFPEYLAYFEEQEELQEQYEQDVMWSFKWMINNFYEFSQISLEQIEKIFDQYAAFCKKFHYSLRTYYEFLGIFIRDNLMPDEKFCGVNVREAFAQMMKSKRDNLSDCKACELDREFDYYLLVEDDLQKALDVIQPVFKGKLQCAEVPHETYAELAEYYFEHGDLKNALEYATKSYRLINKRRDNDNALMMAFAKCTLITAYSEPEKALAMMKKALPFTKGNRNVFECFEFFRAAYHTLYCLEKCDYRAVKVRLPFEDEPIFREQGIYLIPELKGFLYEKAEYYAGLIDRRNHNERMSQKLAQQYHYEIRPPKPKSKLDIPVLEYIEEYLDEGYLPDHFSLPRKKPPKGTPEMPDGAMDGILLYHVEPQPEESEELQNVLRLASEGEEKKAIRQAEQFFSDPQERMLVYVDTLHDFIYEHKEELDPNALYDFALRLTVGSKNYEAVKLGLSVLEVFSDYNDRLIKAIQHLAACDEFTLYCIWALQRLENGNELIFEMARHVAGWGKIFAVNSLKADTEEIREWLLMEGIRTTIHPGYLAMKCFEDVDVPMLLTQKLTVREFNAVGEILLFMVEDGPTMGIRAIEDGEELLDRFLSLAEEGDFAEDGEEFQDIAVNEEVVEAIRNYREGASDEDEDSE